MRGQREFSSRIFTQMAFKLATVKSQPTAPVMPNYGAAVLKRFAKNQFHCLPAVLQENGYSTTWFYAGDASFDGQATFFKKMALKKSSTNLIFQATQKS